MQVKKLGCGYIGSKIFGEQPMISIEELKLNTSEIIIITQLINSLGLLKYVYGKRKVIARVL